MVGCLNGTTWHRLELRQLETFCAVARLQSFTHAAEALHLTQPAVTRQVAALEHELHTRLLERLGRKVELTQSGEKLLEYATQIMRLAEEASRSVTEMSIGAAGRLAIGANNTTATYILPPLLSRFKSIYPGVEMSVHTGVSSHVVEMVASNTVDIGVVAYFAPRHGIVEIPLSGYATGVVTYPTHPLAISDTPVEIEQLAGENLILMEQGTSLRAYVESLLSAHSVKGKVAMELDNVEAIKKMIEAGLGISLLPFVSVKAEVENAKLSLIKLKVDSEADRKLSIIYRKDKYLSATLKAFLELLRNDILSED